MEEDELIWQDGTAQPEYCIDKDSMTSPVSSQCLLDHVLCVQTPLKVNVNKL